MADGAELVPITSHLQSDPSPSAWCSGVSSNEIHGLVCSDWNHTPAITAAPAMHVDSTGSYE